ncbi:transcriptional regulator PpsR [Aureimonas leprariae]|uniref:Transcriptional regulator PpsR n=1 Tax=Plantimonas leprariae TaxID=2615207 RepID=A0A7V7PQB8_9HYPH|nr:transcriptional regulator PpsR [Aureimonas leprariae]KAB0680341.1 transcriptional regulator PpsR [Aureimonas leprariae]
MFAGLDAEAATALAMGNSDVAVVLSPSGHVLDVAFRDGALAAWAIEAWVGKPWRDTVTPESREKIDGLLASLSEGSPTRPRQVNHPAADRTDLPVSYRVVAFANSPNRIAFGTDLRPMAEMQQRLVTAQVEMEDDYRKLRDVEARYRIVFHLAAEPMLIVEGQTLRVLEANEGAIEMLGRRPEKLIGLPATSIFSKLDQAAAAESLRGIEARGRADAFDARQAATQERLFVRAIPFRMSGRTNLLLRLGREEPVAQGRAGADDAMAELVRAIPDGLIVLDEKNNIVDANPAFLDLIRVMTFDRIEDRAVDNWLGGSSVDVQVLMANLREHGVMRRFASVVRDDLGGGGPIEVSAARFSGRQGPLFGLAIREVSNVQPIHPGFVVNRPDTGLQLTELVGRVPLKDVVRDTADVIEKLCIEAALRLTENNRASAADMLGLSRQSLYLKMKRYNIADVDGAGTDD